MNLNHYDIDLLKIACWCKQVPAGMNLIFQTPVFDDAAVTALVKQELLFRKDKKDSYRPRRQHTDYLTKQGMIIRKTLLSALTLPLLPAGVLIPFYYLRFTVQALMCSRVHTKL
jgi:hypothetical protein